jgi:hypothetical protein
MDPLVGMGVAVLAAARVALAWMSELAHMLAERSRRTTLVAVIQAVPKGAMLVEERSDGSRIVVVRPVSAPRHRG